MQVIKLGQVVAHEVQSKPLRAFTHDPFEPKKLRLAKWTAVKPIAKQKHFLVNREIQPEVETDPVEFVEIESVFSKATQIIKWCELQNDEVWRQGWVWGMSALVRIGESKFFTN